MFRSDLIQSQTIGPQIMSTPASNLHHMQQLLQQHVLSPTQLQNFMKQHTLFQQQHQVIIVTDISNYWSLGCCF